MPLHEPHASSVFRIFQELLTNAAKHAKASKIAVKIDHRVPELDAAP